MTVAVTQPVAAPPGDPVRMALDNPELRASLVNHALAVVGRYLAGRPATDRADKAKEAVKRPVSGRFRNVTTTTQPGR